MAISNRERINRALEALRPELAKYVEQELRNSFADQWDQHLSSGYDGASGPLFDNQKLLNTMLDKWNDVFQYVLHRDIKGLIHDCRKWRNKHAHDEPFTFDDTLQALIDIQHILEATASPTAEEIEKSKIDFMRQQFEGEAKKEQKKSANLPLSGLEVAGLRPWRDIITPHADVARGTFQQAEFAADLWQVFKGEGSDEYRKPIDFYQRTFLTDGLRELLSTALQRLTGTGGDPVVELQINFGGGKTHSMLALYHLFGGQAKSSDLPGIEDVLKNTGVKQAPTVARAVVVGTAMRPGSPTTKDDGTIVRTVWGEIAWQLAGRSGYDIVRDVDMNATNPGDLLDDVFKLAGPSLILIDEWVAYARQLFERQNLLPAGDFDTQFTFAQTLCEAARRAKNVLVCISIPASTNREGDFLPSSQVGDQAGQSALGRLKDAVGRSNMVWRPATNDESFEIVRRRLFEPISGDLVPARDAVIAEFMSFYRANSNEFPADCRDAEYERRMRASYPIHPELFDRLYNDWSTLEKFQKTRGVLRLMASVIHSLWKNNDASALIMPAVVPIADPTVQTEITRYLPENWTGVLDCDVDGQGSIPLQLDGEFASTYGRFSACRRVARTVFLGSAPTNKAATRGIEEKRIKLGCVQPKETIATFGDALNRLRQKTTYMYVDNTRFWYNTQASVNREAQNRAERCTVDAAHVEIVRRLRDMTGKKNSGEFSYMHVDVVSSDLPDDRELRLVILSSKYSHKQGKADSSAIKHAAELLQFRGSAPRNNKNRLVFAAVDEGRSPELETAVKQFLAWQSIVKDIAEEKMEADSANRRQAQTSAEDAAVTVQIKLGEVYQWVVVPFQPDPTKPIQWESQRVSGGADTLATRIVRKLDPEHITRKMAGNYLRKWLDDIPLWRDGGRVTTAQLLEDFARYTYLPRLLDDQVLFDAVRDGVNRMGGMDGFAFADSYDEATGEFERLRTGILLEGSRHLDGVVVSLDVAMPIIEAEKTRNGSAPAPTSGSSTSQTNGGTGSPTVSGGLFGGPSRTSTGPDQTIPSKRRFHGSIRLSSSTLASKAGEVSREVVQHLAKTLGARVDIIIEIQAENGNGFADEAARVVSENCRTLGFDSFEFEDE